MLKTLTALAVLSACAANAQTVQCGGAPDMHAALSQRYGESPAAASGCATLGIVGRCIRWENATSGTWSWVFYPGDGRACLIASGRNKREAL